MTPGDAEKTVVVEEQIANDNLDELVEGGGVQRAYELKSDLVNRCLQEEIGFGRYQIQLFLVTGLGWMADNIWAQGVAIVLNQIQQEWNPKRIELVLLSLYAGLGMGAITWGTIADIVGRKVSFNITLFIAGVFGTAAGASPDFVTLNVLVALLGFGVGGNIPVDGALYLEHIPQSHQYTVTFLSVMWAFGQLVASVVAWGFIANFSCDPSILPGECAKGANMGWRYTFYALGALTFVMFLLRFVVFDLQESSKYLVAKGRDEEALAVLRHLAKRNGREITLTLEHIQRVKVATHISQKESIKNSFSQLSLSHLKPLFAGRRLAINTTMTMSFWVITGIASTLFFAFLPLYLAHRVDSDSSTYTVYRNYTIISIVGMVGPALACLFVDSGSRGPPGRFRLMGRKLSMVFETLLTGILLFLFTLSTNEAAVLAFTCISSAASNAMYAVMYTYTLEVFPTPHRGTGESICSLLTYVASILGLVIQIATKSAEGGTGSATANASILVAASLFIVAALLMALLLVETAGRAAL
ncbi:MFS general substrate transporter [Schizophyllum commune H4-8]|nr:MFS general substrate transporter [Schizophyllum commune H4-8]KAI5888960.1 MFS general substrate transporter [Schizophyllum commune H4-8]